MENNKRIMIDYTVTARMYYDDGTELYTNEWSVNKIVGTISDSMEQLPQAASFKPIERATKEVIKGMYDLCEREDK